MTRFKVTQHFPFTKRIFTYGSRMYMWIWE
ncbi:rCG49183 [Rattus norvegicus]|uniref:RCG49183 n=1 Tax=Rattus norvegicus TaxID=10116 RepID=A6IG54_RAT|nr:rCG49183 [Rattus norvegicus]